MEYFEKDDYAQLKERFINKVKYLSMWIWKNDLSREDIQKWLDNFNGLVDNNIEHEEINSLFLLKQYMFFSLTEVRQLLSAMYRLHFYKDYIQRIRKETNINDTSKLSQLYLQELKQTRFLGIGNPSESSSLLLYFFRQENKLPKTNFWNLHEIFLFGENAEIIGLRNHKENNFNQEEVSYPINNYIFIDDLSGSGTQATDYFLYDTSINIVKKITEYNKSARIFYFTLISTEKARKKFKEVGLENIIIKSIFELDETYKVFNDASRYFNPYKEETPLHIQEREYSKLISEKNFNKLLLNPIYKYGYNDSQLLLSFFYNTPDNTLPIFWVENEQWNSIFKRYDKIYY